ncbi:MAG: hypothetical protein AAGA92_01360 [Planctomycetota bacterium]
MKMYSSRSQILIRALTLSALFSSAAATAIAVPIFDTFGPLDEATFGGQGIPNDEVAVSRQFTDGNDIEITVALSATQRFSNPALSNDGAGTYFATPGSNFGGNGESGTEGALWNFNFYIAVEGFNGATPLLTDYQIDLKYDFDPASGTPVGDLGSIDLTNSLLFNDPNSILVEDSQNLLFSFLGTSVPGFLVAPSGSFDQNALGEYTFAITISGNGFPIETVAMNVEVIPEPTALFLASLAGVALLGRRR